MTWFLKVKCSSTIIPKNFKELLLSITELPTEIGGKYVVFLCKNKLILFSIKTNFI